MPVETAESRGVLRARPRLLLALLAGFGAGVVSLLIPSVQRERELVLMIVWSSVCAAWLLSVHLTLKGFDYDCTRQTAVREDDGRATSRTLLTAGAVISLLAVGASLFRAHDLAKDHSPMEIVVTLGGVVTVVLTWLLVHVENLLHYAHLYYKGDDGGIDFHTEYGEKDGPTYRDFAYLAFTVGMTYQVSDTEITDPEIRRAILHHALLSYLFGTILVALIINGLASLAG